MRISTALRYDVLFQFRHGFYYAYLVISIFYIIALYLLPDSLRGQITVYVLFSDIAMIGFFFVGAIVLLEKGQNILQNIFATPLRLWEYFCAKTASLTLLALISALLIVFIVHGLIPNLFLFILGLVLSAAFYTLFGMIVVANSRSVNDYFGKALGLGILLSAPLMNYLGIFKSPFFYLLPSQATLIVLDLPFFDHAAWQIIYAFVCLLAWSGIASWIAYQRFYKFIILKSGAGA